MESEAVAMAPPLPAGGSALRAMAAAVARFGSTSLGKFFTVVHLLPRVRVLSVLCLLFSLTLLGACVPASLPPVVKLALIAPFEGPSRPLGYAVLDAVHLRLEQWNASGQTPRVELIALNDDGRAELAARLPAQIAVDPAVWLVLGPPQGHTAAAAIPQLAALGLPTLALAPLPDDTPAPVVPFAGRYSDLQTVLAPYAGRAGIVWSLPLARPGIWIGDPLSLAEMLAADPDAIPAAGAVAGEEAFAAWREAGAGPLVWAAAVPALPVAFAGAYEARHGAPPTPAAMLAYAALDAALPHLAQSTSRTDLGRRLAQLSPPPYQVFQRESESCCQPLAPP